MNPIIKLMWADPRFQVYAKVLKLLEGDRIWGGMDWHYNPIHPTKYLSVRDQVRKALDDVKAEYGVDQTSHDTKPWQGLTDDEIADCFQNRGRNSDGLKTRKLIAAAIEAMLREKNT